MVFIIFIATLLVCLFIFCVTMEWIEERDDKRNRFYRTEIRKGDRFYIKGLGDPFKISDKQIAVIIDKEESYENGKKYILFVCNNVKYSCEYLKFVKYWQKVPNSSSLNKIDVDTNVNENYQMFKHEYTKEIIKKQNNTIEWGRDK